jgi:hypothetical protein
LRNIGFETGDLSGWVVGGLASVVEVLEASNFNPQIAPPSGKYFAILATGPDIINNEYGQDLDGNEIEDNDVSTLSQTFRVTNPTIIQIWWSFLTSEEDENYDDFFYIELNGEKILTGSASTGWTEYVSPFPNVPPLDGIEYTVTSPGPADGNLFWRGRTTWQSFRYAIKNPGIYTLTILIADQINHGEDTGLLIDAKVFPLHKKVIIKLKDLKRDVSELPKRAFKYTWKHRKLTHLLRRKIYRCLRYVKTGRYKRALITLKHIKYRLYRWTINPWKINLIGKVNVIIHILQYCACETH